MAATTTLLGLVTPTQGTLSGTWGDTVNYGISDYVDIAVSGTLTLTNDGAVTLANTTGSSSGSNITSSLTGAGTVTAQFAIVKVTGTLTVAKVVTGPSYSKTYTVVNSATGSTVTFKASGQTGVSIAVGETAFVYFNGTDYVKIVGTATAGAAGGSTTQVQFNSSGALAGSANMTFNGTTLTVNDFTDSSLTSGRVTYAGTAGNLNDSANLTFDGTNLTVGGSATATRFIPSGATVATNGMYLPAANSLGFSTNSTEAMRIGSDGNFGIGQAPSAGITFNITKALTGATGATTLSARINPDVTVTTSAVGYGTFAINGVGTSTSSITHFFANQGTFSGTGPANHYGFYAASTLTGGTNNFGFYGDIASGTGRFNFYAAGTAENFFGGNTVISVTDNTNAALRITQLGTGDALLVQDSANPDSSPFVIDASGSVIQGTTTLPTGLVGPAFAIVGSTAFGPQFLLSNKAVDTSASYILFRKDRAGAIVNSGDANGNIQFSGFDGTNNIVSARIESAIDGTPGTNDMPGRLVFSTTADGASTPTERLRIASTGAFGLSGANYGTNGQVLTSGGSAAAPTWTTVGGTGDVVGPASSTDNAFARFDSTTGKLLQNSTGATLSDTGAAVFTGALDVLGNSTAGSNLKLYEDTDNGTHYVSFKAPDTIASNVTWTLPSADGTNTQVLQTNGSGVLSFATVSGGGSPATPTVEGTVYGKMVSSSTATTALGYNALVNNTGARNTAVGWNAAPATGAGADLTAIGKEALASNTSGNYNVAVGGNDGATFSPLTSNTTGSSNVAIGNGSLGKNTTASDNTAVGYRAGFSNTTGYSNVALGHSALFNNSTAAQNCAIGHTALYTNTTGNSLVALGYEALYSNTTANGNTALGYQALKLNTTGASNTAVGTGSLGACTTGLGNVAMGNSSAQALTTGQNNVCIGRGAGLIVTTGNENTMIGRSAGEFTGPTTGSRNVLIGLDARASATGGNDQLVIVSGSTATGKGDSTGFIHPNGGGVYQGNNSSTWSTTSDRRLKKNIVDNNDGLDKINAICVRNFEYRLPEEVDAELKPADAIIRSGVQLGVIAQELQAVLPECVKQESTGVMSVDTDNLIWYAINAIKELKAEVDSLKSQLQGN